MNSTSNNLKIKICCNLYKGENDLFYYLYKITNNINNKYYYGVHCTDNIEDNYSGSGKLLQYAYKKYGFENFTKEILECFSNKEDMFNKEYEIVNEKIVKDKNSYNMRIGGTGNSKGQSIMKDKDGNYIVVLKTDEKYNEYVGVSTGKKFINKNGKNKVIDENEIEKYIGNGWNIGSTLKNTLNRKYITNGKENRLVSKKEIQKYIDGDWKLGITLTEETRNNNIKYNKTHISAKDKNGKSLKILKSEFTDEYVGVTKDYKWITNGIENKSLLKEEAESFLSNNPDWRYGCLIKQNKNNKRNTGKTMIYKDNVYKTINKNELQKYLDNGWIKKGKSKGSGTIIVNKDNRESRIQKNKLQEYLNNGWKKGRCAKSTKGRIAVIKNNKVNFINEEDLTKYLNDGWVKRGKTKNLGKKYIHKGDIYKLVPQNELQKYLDDGWIAGNKSTIKGKIYINKNGINKVINKEDLNIFIQNGWSKGKIKAEK